jgi:threonylcarbamoyladenosine tRNA methylthiotransferase MtaB
MFFHLYTLGCKVNQYESEFVRCALLRHGYTETDEGDVADLIIVNTCTVTADSEVKSRKAIRKLVRKNPVANVVVMGCAATHQPDAMLQIDGVSQILTDKEQLPDFLRQLLTPNHPCPSKGGELLLPKGIESFGERHRAFVKVQDGCNAGCTYCIIPKVRPVMRSRPIEDILPEIRTLARNGYREIVLTGIHLGHYGVDIGGHPILTKLIRRIVDLPEEFRLRLSSLEASEVHKDLTGLMLRYPDRLCPHLHLPMQSGSTEILRLMKRRMMRKQFLRRCKEILARFDRLALTTDIIVGFPGETMKHFDETWEIIRQIRFSKVHIFRYSPREGTEAAELPRHVPPSEQKRRAALLKSLTDNLRTEFAASLVGSRETVLLETPTTGTCGRYLDVQLDSPMESGTLVPVLIERSEGEHLAGALINEQPYT